MYRSHLAHLLYTNFWYFSFTRASLSHILKRFLAKATPYMKSSKTAMLKGCLSVLVENSTMRAYKQKLNFIIQHHDFCSFYERHYEAVLLISKSTSEPSRADDPMVLNFASTQYSLNKFVKYLLIIFVPITMFFITCQEPNQEQDH